MNLTAILATLSSILFIVSASFYVRDVAVGKVTPNVASFMIFSFINASLLTSLIIKGVWPVALFTGIALLASLLVSFLSLKYKRFYFGIVDKVALSGAVLALIAWLVTKDASWNVYVLTTLSALTFLPIIYKAFKYPRLETLLPWQLNLLASVFLILTVPSTDVVEWAVPAQQLLCSTLLNIGLIRGRMKTQGAKT